MKKKPKNKRIAKYFLTIALAVVLVIVSALALPLVISYHRNAYAKSDIIERSGEYVAPETDPQPSEWADVTLRELETDGDEPMTKVPYTLADGLDRNASFGRNKNALSVFGKTPIYKVEKKDPDIENILVLGTDSRDITKDRGRSDAMIIVSYNKKTGSVKMFSVLRDSLVPIEGVGWNKINSAYSIDGAGLAVNTVNQLFDLDIQRFVVIDFNGVTDFVDRAGGVTISLTQAEVDYMTNYSQGKVKYKVGPNKFNGDRTLIYMRIRKIDNDFNRTARQRNVIETLTKKILTEKSLPEIYSLTDFAFRLVKTNIPLAQLTKVAGNIAADALQSNFEIESHHVPFDGTYTFKYYNGMSVISFDTDDAAERVNKIIYG